MRREEGGPVAVLEDVGGHGGPDAEGGRALEVGRQQLRHGSGIRALGGADEVDPHRPPQPGDLPEPPAGRLLGSAGGPVIAQVAASELHHLVHHARQLGPAGRSCLARVLEPTTHLLEEVLSPVHLPVAMRHPRPVISEAPLTSPTS